MKERDTFSSRLKKLFHKVICMWSDPSNIIASLICTLLFCEETFSTGVIYRIQATISKVPEDSFFISLKDISASIASENVTCVDDSILDPLNEL